MRFLEGLTKPNKVLDSFLYFLLDCNLHIEVRAI